MIQDELNLNRLQISKDITVELQIPTNLKRNLRDSEEVRDLVRESKPQFPVALHSYEY